MRWTVLFFLMLCAAAVSAQVARDQSVGTPIAELLDEVAGGGEKEFRTRFDKFQERLVQSRDSVGFVINYGTEQEIADREKLVRDGLWRRSHIRLTIVRGGQKGKAPVTEFWLVPPGAASPLQARPVAARLEEFGAVSDRYFYNVFYEFLKRTAQEKTVKGYILIRGNEAETAAFEERIRGLGFFATFDTERVVFVKRPRTIAQATIALWFVPENAEIPEDLK